MKQKIKFKYISNNGNIGSKIIGLDIPDFDNSEYYKIEDIPEPSYESHVMEYLDNMDKTYLMDKNNWFLILSYNVVDIKKSKDDTESVNNLLIFKTMNELFTDERMLNDFKAVYVNMYDSIKNIKSLTKRINIVLDAMSVGYKSQTVAYERILKIMKCESSEDMRKLIDSDKQIKITNEL